MYGTSIQAVKLRGLQLQLSKQYRFYSRRRQCRDGGRDKCRHERYRLRVLLKVDRVVGREWYGTIDCQPYESPDENEEKGVDDQNSGWDNIVWARIPAHWHRSINVQLRINNPKDKHV